MNCKLQLKIADLRETVSELTRAKYFNLLEAVCAHTDIIRKLHNSILREATLLMLNAIALAPLSEYLDYLQN